MSSIPNLQDHFDSILENDNNDDGIQRRCDSNVVDSDIEQAFCETDAQEDDIPPSIDGAATIVTGGRTIPTTATTVRLPCGREVDAKNTCQSHSLVRLEDCEDEKPLESTLDDATSAPPQSQVPSLPSDKAPISTTTTTCLEGSMGMVRPQLSTLNLVHVPGNTATSTIEGGGPMMSVITTDATSTEPSNIASSSNNRRQNDIVAVVARMETGQDDELHHHHCDNNGDAPFATARILGSHAPPAIVGTAVHQLHDPELIPVPSNEDSAIVPSRDTASSSSDEENNPSRTDPTLQLPNPTSSTAKEQQPTNQRRRRAILLISLAIAAGVVLFSGIVSTAVICSATTVCTIGRGGTHNTSNITGSVNSDGNNDTIVTLSNTNSSTNDPTTAPTSGNGSAMEANQTDTNRTEVLELFINTVTFTGREVKVHDAHSDKTMNLPAEELSLVWLIDQDLLQLWPDSAMNRFRLVQRYALMTLWFQQLTTTGDSTWTRTSGWASTDSECAWYGIQCQQINLGPGIGSQDAVTHINLQENNLVGVLSPELGLLSSLIGVNLSGNRLSGIIPSSLQHWSHLETFDGGRGFGSNAFSNPNWETVMAKWSKNMRFFSYSSNGAASGSLPSMIGTWWPELEHFDVYDSGFTGILPSSMGNWSRLTSLTLSDNAFTGSLPNWIGQWTNLQIFDISYCTFASGTIPETVGRWSNVSSVNIQKNGFTGTLPDSIGNWTNLLSLDIAENSLQGTLPNVVQKWTKVQSISAFANALNGSLPSGLEQWTDLDYLDLSKNHFTGSLPESIGSWTKVRTVFFLLNSFQGTLPTTMGGWTSIEYLDASLNMLTGPIPDYVGNWTNIRDVLLYDNALTGSFPAAMSRWMSSLGSLALYSNLLSGTLPDFTWTYINQLQLQSNAFSGTLPNTVGMWTNLEFLDLTDNRFGGTLPSVIGNWRLMGALNLGNNSFTGTLPASIGKWTSMTRFHIEENHFTGTMPESVVNWSMIQSVRFFGNNFNRSVTSAFCFIRDVTFTELVEDCNSPEEFCSCCTNCM